MASMMQTMHDPTYRNKLEAKMSAMKEDPELAPILEEMEKGGPAAMMRCAPLPHLGMRSTHLALIVWGVQRELIVFARCLP